MSNYTDIIKVELISLKARFKVISKFSTTKSYQEEKMLSAQIEALEEELCEKEPTKEDLEIIKIDSYDRKTLKYLTSYYIAKHKYKNRYICDADGSVHFADNRSVFSNDTVKHTKIPHFVKLDNGEIIDDIIDDIFKINNKYGIYDSNMECLQEGYFIADLKLDV